jgi:hypothetical protein
MQYSSFEHPSVIDSHVVDQDGRKVLVIRTTLMLDEASDGFDRAAIHDLCNAFASYAERYPAIREGRLVRVCH